MLKIMVISSCTQTKDKRIPCMFKNCQELKNINWRVWKNNRENRQYLLKSSEMYKGRSFKAVIKSCKIIRPNHTVKHYIFSGGLGWITEDEYIPNYECGLRSLAPFERKERTKSLLINEVLKKIIEKYNFDVIFVLLGQEYLESLEESFEFLNKRKTVVLTKFSKLDTFSNIIQIPTDISLLKQIKENNLPNDAVTNLKGHIFSLFTQMWNENIELVNNFMKDWTKEEIEKLFAPRFIAEHCTTLINNSIGKATKKSLLEF